MINLFDYHQRVPTQIDRFKLLKSVAFKGYPFERVVYSNEIIISVNHFFINHFIFLAPLVVSEVYRDNGGAL
ncbi:hypothetical protein GCU72_10000 [Vibrio sp. B1Z05]|nr:hypothetical protein [Vibrio sp. B1Z05]